MVKFDLGAKTWRNPEAEKKWLEAEAKRKESEEEQKKKDEEQKLIDEETRKLQREEMLSTGRSHAIETAEARLAELRAEVAALEAKRTGKTAAVVAELDARSRAAKEMEDRAKAVSMEAEAQARAMVAAKEKELGERKKKHDEEQRQLDETRRRELLNYKHSLGLLSPNVRPRNGQRPPGFHPRGGATPQGLYRTHPGDSTKIYDDPDFWVLPPDHQAFLESLTAEEQEREGWGPYDTPRSGPSTLRRDPLGDFDGGGGEKDLFRARRKAAAAQRLGIPKAEVKPPRPRGYGGCRDEGFGAYLREAIMRGEAKYDQAGMDDFICVTTESVPGFKVEHVFGEFSGSAQRRKPRDTRMLSAHELQILQYGIENTRRHALSDLVKRALCAGANAILGLKFDSSTPVSDNEVCVWAYGTGVVLVDDRPDYAPLRPRHPGNPYAHISPTGPPGFDPFVGMDPRAVAEWKRRDPKAVETFVAEATQKAFEDAKARAEQVPYGWWAPPPIPPRPAPQGAWGRQPPPVPPPLAPQVPGYGPRPNWPIPPPEKKKIPQGPQESWRDYVASYSKKKAGEMRAAKAAEGGDGDGEGKKGGGGNEGGKKGKGNQQQEAEEDGETEEKKGTGRAGARREKDRTEAGNRARAAARKDKKGGDADAHLLGVNSGLFTLPTPKEGPATPRANVGARTAFKEPDIARVAAMLSPEDGNGYTPEGAYYQDGYDDDLDYADYDPNDLPGAYGSEDEEALRQRQQFEAYEEQLRRAQGHGQPVRPGGRGGW